MAASQALIGEYLRGLAAAGRPATTVGLRRIQLRHMAAAVGKPLEQVTGPDLLDWFAVQGWRPETRRSYRTVCRGFFGWHAAVYGGADPALVLPPVPQHNGAPRPTPDAVWVPVLADAGPRLRLMLLLAGEAGLRRGEIARLRGEDLLDGPALLIHGKGGRDRVIPIGDRLAGLVAAAPTEDGWVFGNGRGGPLTAGRVGELCSALLPPGCTLHHLRHRFASNAYRGSRDIRAVQELLGHASVATTQRYTAVGEGDLRAAMSAASLGEENRN